MEEHSSVYFSDILIHARDEILEELSLVLFSGIFHKDALID